MTYYRNKALLEACRKLPCQMCGVEDGTVCAAHSNLGRHGHGMGIKSHDTFVAALCAKHHFEIDNGKTLSREERENEWTMAHESTLIELFKRGLVVVA